MHTSAVTSDFENLLVISTLPLHRYYTSRPPEPALMIVLSVAQHPPFGTNDITIAAVHCRRPY